MYCPRVYYALIKPHAVYIKEGDFFADQGGLTEDWGNAWEAISAENLEGAYAKAVEIKKERYSATR